MTLSAPDMPSGDVDVKMSAPDMPSADMGASVSVPDIPSVDLKSPKKSLFGKFLKKKSSKASVEVSRHHLLRCNRFSLVISQGTRSPFNVTVFRFFFKDADGIAVIIMIVYVTFRS